MMMRLSNLFLVSLLGISVTCTAYAGVNFDPTNTMAEIKSLYGLQATNQEQQKIVQEKEQMMKNLLSQHKLFVISDSVSKPEDWRIVAPKNVEEVLKIDGEGGANPDEDVVSSEVSKIAFVKTKTPSMQKKTTKQQNRLAFNVANNAQATAEYSVDLAEKAITDIEAIKKMIDETSAERALMEIMINLQVSSMRKNRELMNLWSRMAEVKAASSLVGYLEPRDSSELLESNMPDAAATN